MAKPISDKKAKVSPDDKAKRLRELSDDSRFKDLFPPLADEAKSLEHLIDDLKEVPVLDRNCRVINVFQKIEQEDKLSRQDKDVIWKCLALVREAYLHLENQERDTANRGYQWNMNWKHTRAELDQVYEASLVLGLGSEDTRDAIIASIFSDSVKTRGNFIIHNIHGSQAAAQALSYIWGDASMPSIERIVLAIKQHQIAPPTFMARTVAQMLCSKLGLDSFERIQLKPSHEDRERSHLQHTICSIFSKIKDPYRQEYLTKDLDRINFSDDERALLQMLGIEDWWVPHPDLPGSIIAHALIAGDHSINYNNPDGFAKIALIRGPATESVFEDATIYDSLESAMASFADSFNILLPEAKNLALGGIRRTHTAVTRVLRIMTELFSGIVIGAREDAHLVSGRQKVQVALERCRLKHPEIFQSEAVFSSEAGHQYLERTMDRVGSILQEWQDEYGDIPFSPRQSGLSEPGPGRLPFWNTALKYPRRDENGKQQMNTLSHHEQTQFYFAMRIREIAVELLRAEQWFFSSLKGLKMKSNN